MGNTFYFEWEAQVLLWIQSLLGDFGVKIAELVTMFGEELIIVGVLGFLYWAYDKKFGIFVGTNIIVALVLNPMVKNIFLRRRPYLDIEGVECLRPISEDADISNLSAQGYSFPSGHSTSATAVYASLPVYRRRGWLVAVAIVLPLLVGLSRACLGVHYPTDVIVGWLLGLFAVVLMSFVQRRVKRRWIMYAIITALSLIGCFYCTSKDYFTSLGMMIGFFAGNLFEEKFVRFEDDRRPLAMLVRFVGGVVIFLGLNSLLKLPFPSDLLSSANPLSYAIRVCRYAIVLFVDVALYPMLFKWIKKK
jgi:undecaprenyl-diphosphatase